MRVLRNGIEISDTDIKCLQYDLLNIEDWIQNAIIGKTAACRGRLIEQWMPILIADPDVSTIPADDTAIIGLITSRSDYRDRSEREADLTA